MNSAARDRRVRAADCSVKSVYTDLATTCLESHCETIIAIGIQNKYYEFGQFGKKLFLLRYNIQKNILTWIAFTKLLDY